MNKFEQACSPDTKNTDGLSLRQRVWFHYFNPNGLYAEQKILDAEVDALVEAKKVTFGWVMAYGSLDSFHYRELTALNNKKRPSGIEVSVFESMYRERNERVRKKIEEAKAKE